MKTILYLITQSEFGGAQKYVLDSALGLKDEFNICVAVGEQGEAGEFANELKNNGIDVYVISRLKREISPLNDLLAIFEIIKLIKKLKPDIIHLNSSKISIIGSIAASISKLLIVNYKLLIVYTVHGWVFNEPLPKWKKSFYFFAEKFTSHFKDKIICISKLDYDIAKNQLKIKEKKLTLIYHGIEPINFLSREEAIKKLLQIINNSLSLTKGENERGWRDATPPHPTPLLSKEREIIIGTIANLYKTKGLEYLIEAVSILINELRVTSYELRVIIIGEGEERENLLDLIGQLNLKSHIFLLGNIKNASSFLPAFDIYVNSSVKEGFPYSILEAMSAGLPIVATRVGGVPEMIDDEISGLLIEPQNPQALAEKIKILIEDKNLRKAFGEQAKQKVEKEFKIDKMIGEMKNIYAFNGKTPLLTKERRG